MNKFAHVVLSIVLVLSFAGCAQNKTRVAEGAGGGAAVGAQIEKEKPEDEKTK